MFVSMFSFVISWLINAVFRGNDLMFLMLAVSKAVT